jgi:hypothetical protein
MSRKQLAMTMAAAALCIAAGSTPVSAQQSCGNLYNQVMETYQTLGPQSPQYAQMVDRYNASCFSGSSMPSSAYPAPAGGEGGGASVPGDHRRLHDYRSQRG